MTLQLVQWCVFLALGGIVVALSPMLAHSLTTSVLSHQTIVTCIALSGLCIGVAQPRSLYSSGLNGLGRQVTCNVLLVSFAALRGLTTLSFLKFHNSAIVTFFIVQLAWFAIETFCTALVFWRALPAGSTRPHLAILEEVRNFATADAGFFIATMILTTGDKVIISHSVPLDQFGQYGLITLVCLTLPKLIGPFATAYFHEFTVAWQHRDFAKLSREYGDASDLANPIVIAAGLVLVLFAYEIMAVLSGSATVAERFELPLQLYALGSVLYALQYIPHALQLGAGWPGLALKVYAIAAAIYVPAIYFSTPIWGIVAPPAIWARCKFDHAPTAGPSHAKRLLPDAEYVWFKNALVKPFAACSIVLLIVRAALRPAGTSLGMICELVLVAAAAALAVFLSSEKVRSLTFLLAAKVINLGRMKPT